MTTKTTGAEYKAYLHETSAQWWPDQAYMDEEVLIVNGTSTEDSLDFDSSKLQDSDTVVIAYGNYYEHSKDHDPIALETHFKRWRKAQTTIRAAFECPKDKLDAVKAAIKAAGGKVV